jgi:hypothetical protein
MVRQHYAYFLGYDVETGLKHLGDEEGLMRRAAEHSFLRPAVAAQNSLCDAGGQRAGAEGAKRAVAAS